jgi:hypothetical protein
MLIFYGFKRSAVLRKSENDIVIDLGSGDKSASHGSSDDESRNIYPTNDSVEVLAEKLNKMLQTSQRPRLTNQWIKENGKLTCKWSVIPQD